jgi:hypothetical protein
MSHLHLHARLIGVFVALAALLVPAGARAQPGGPAPQTAGAPLRVHVRGGAELHAVAGAAHGAVRLHGQLVDDAGAPIPKAILALDATSTEEPHARLHVGPLRPCEDAVTGARPLPHGGPDDLLIETDEHGEFCAVARAAAPKMNLEIRFRATKLHDAAELSLPVDMIQPHLVRTVLRFEPPPETLDLDRETLTVTAKLSFDRSDAARQSAGDEGPGGAPQPSLGTAQRANLALTLMDERGAHIADAVTGGDGRARFEIKTAALAGPGPGELVVRFAGNAVLTNAEWSQPILRRAEARLALAHPIVPADPEDGVIVDVDASTSRGPVTGGVVEARRIASTSAAAQAGAASDSVGAGMIDENGHARIVATFSAGGATLAPLSLRFVPAAEWYRPGPELRVEARLAGPGVGRQILLAVTVLVAAAWVIVGWRRSPRPPALPGVDGSAAPRSGRAGVQVLASPADLTGWRGTVADAHDGALIAGARVSIVLPAFAGDGVAARAVTDEHGAFSIEAPYRNDGRLVVDAPEHSTHEQPLPPPSVLAVTLITRRRAILERLVRWARQRGAPFDGTSEPTPGHVRRVAARSSAQEIEAWAGRVEQAAFGPQPVDEAIERDVRATEPRATG